MPNTGPKNPATAFAGVRRVTGSVGQAAVRALGAITGAPCPPLPGLETVQGSALIVERGLLVLHADEAPGAAIGIALLYTDGEDSMGLAALGIGGFPDAGGTYITTLWPNISSGAGFGLALGVTELRNAGIGLGLWTGGPATEFEGTLDYDITYRLFDLTGGEDL